MSKLEDNLNELEEKIMNDLENGTETKKSLLEDFHKDCLRDIDTICKTLTKSKRR